VAAGKLGLARKRSLEELDGLGGGLMGSLGLVGVLIAFKVDGDHELLVYGGFGGQVLHLAFIVLALCIKTT
jgi:hypothetical protein